MERWEINIVILDAESNGSTPAENATKAITESIEGAQLNK